MSGYLGQQPRTVQCDNIKLVLYSLITLLLLIMPLPLFSFQKTDTVAHLFFKYIFSVVTVSDCVIFNRRLYIQKLKGELLQYYDGILCGKIFFYPRISCLP